MTLRTSIPSLLREARNRGALSQRALADFAGTAQSVVGRIEAGLTSPTVETVSQLFEAAGFDLKMEIVPRQTVDPVIEAYKPGIDRTLLVENLRRSVDERLRINAEVQLFGNELRRAMRVAEGTP
ncbi:MAG TPA: helix-turn-helix transcriptional regulator [Gemmatimonadaceae bacterium]|nr:helix-turn-helix transcriptional regulator [Gemmatimonadaceae bacterium]